jgi:hypothetical protein
MIKQNTMPTPQDLFLKGLHQLVFNYTDIEVNEYIYERSEIEDIFENITHLSLYIIQMLLNI